MTQPTTFKLSKWLLWSPLKFVISYFLWSVFLTVFLIAVIAVTAKTFTNMTTLTFGVEAALLCIGCTYLMIRDLPHDNLNRDNFVGLINLQMPIMTLLFLIPMLIIARNPDVALFKLILLSHTSRLAFVLLIIFIALVYFYVFGLLISSVYAKFRRARTMGIPTWKIICSMPMGFSLIWVPGYLMPENKNMDKNQTGKYMSLTRNITKRPIICAAVFTAITLLSSPFFGFNLAMLTLAYALVFCIWVMTIGTKPMIKNIGGAYSTFAVAANIVMLLVILLVFYITPHTTTTDFPAPNEQLIIQTQQ